jgi:hypothetical protein
MASKKTKRLGKSQKMRKQSVDGDRNVDLRPISETGALIVEPGDPTSTVANSMHIQEQLKQSLALELPEAFQPALEVRLDFPPFLAKFNFSRGWGREDMAEEILRRDLPGVFEELLNWVCARIEFDPAPAGFALDALCACIEKDQLGPCDTGYEVAAFRRLFTLAVEKGFDIVGFDRGPVVKAMFAALAAEAAAKKQAEAIAQSTAMPQSRTKTPRL